MFLRLRDRAAPTVLLVLSGLWMALVILPLFYSLLFPNVYVKHVVRALESKETLSGDLASLVEQVNSSAGRLKHAIQVGAYWGVSVEYKGGESHTMKTTELSYLAWFEKQSGPTIFVLTRTEVDGSWVRYRTHESTIFAALRIYLLPAFVVAVSAYWLKRRRAPEASAAPQ